MSTPISSVAGVRLIVGMSGATTGVLRVVSFRGGNATSNATPVVTVSSGSAAVGSWTDYGADNAAESGSHVLSVCEVTITGLVANSAITGTVAHDGVNDSFSFRTQPSASDSFTYAMTSCIRHRDSRYVGSAPWDNLKSKILSENVLFLGFIDDVGYVDRWKQTDHADPDSTGIMLTADDPQDTELEWDYAAAWAANLGMLDNWSANYASAVWQWANICHVCDPGDHGIANNHCNQAEGVGGIQSNQCRDMVRTQDGAWTTGWSVAVNIFEGLFGHCRFDETMRSGSGFYNGETIGNCCFFVEDRNSFVEPYDAADLGDTFTAGEGHHQVVHGTDTTPPTDITRTAAGMTFTSAPPYRLGEAQVNDMLDLYDGSAADFKVWFATSGITRMNEPYYDLFPNEFIHMLTRRREICTNIAMLKDFTGWTALADTTLGMDSGWSTVTNSDAALGGMSQIVTGLTSGATYTLRGESSSDSTTDLRVMVGTIADQQDLLYERLSDTGGTTWEVAGTETVTFTAPVSGTVHITLKTHNAILGRIAKFRRLSIEGPIGSSYGLMQNPATNGTNGYVVRLLGDTHTLGLRSYEADGSTGLGLDWLSDEELWEVLPGSINGSGSQISFEASRIAGTLLQGCKVRYEHKASASVGDFSPTGFIFGQVTSTRHTLSLWDASTNMKLWEGYQEAGQTGNHFTPTQRKVSAV